MIAVRAGTFLGLHVILGESPLRFFSGVIVLVTRTPRKGLWVSGWRADHWFSAVGVQGGKITLNPQPGFELRQLLKAVRGSVVSLPFCRFIQWPCLVDRLEAFGRWKRPDKNRPCFGVW